MTVDDAGFDDARALMVARHIAARGVKDARVLEAMRRVPRHCFVPEASRNQAYEDHPLQIGHGQTISQPYMVAVMTELLDLTSTDRVLEIGTGSGYQTAILAELAAGVVSVERQAALAQAARERLAALGYTNVAVLSGDGTRGCPKRGPFDAIVVTAGGPRVPSALCDQLADAGRLVCPAGPRDLQTLVKIVRHGDEFVETTSIQCVFVPLIGAEGWPE